MSIRNKRSFFLATGLGATALIAAAAGWGLSPLLPTSPISSNITRSRPIAATPAAYQGSVSVADIVERTEPAVVSITVEQQPAPASFEGNPFANDGPLGEFFRQFAGPGQMRQMPQERREALGSGFVVDDSGDILTNNHVVEAGTRFTVEFADKSIAQAKLVGTDKATDLALIHVDKMPNIQPLTFADSDKLRVGDPVVAIGDPFGVGQTVTTGVVSALGRSLGNSSYVDYIQTDASINRGNSGGPLLDYSGQVVGINSAIFSPSGGNVGIGFAVPSDTAQQVIRDLRHNGKVTRAWLGLGIQDVTPAIAAADGLAKAEGAIITTVDSSGPSSGKLMTGDIVTGFNGTQIREARDLSKAASSAKVGSSATLDIIRKGNPTQVHVTLGKLMPEGNGQEVGMQGGTGGESAPKLGLSVAPLDGDTRQSLGLADNVHGLVITDMDPDGAGAHAGLMTGDVIEKIGGDSVSSPSDVSRDLEHSRNNTALLLVNRRGQESYLTVPLG